MAKSDGEKKRRKHKQRRKERKLRPLDLAPRMAASDALFWYAEQALPQFRSTIAGLYVLDRAPDAQRLDAALDAAIALVPRLRQRVLEVPFGLGLPEWVDDPHFDRRYHLRHVSLAPPGDRRHLLDLAATLFATPFDRERPLWEATWIEGLEGGRSAYLFKMHHAMVDGVGAAAIADAITQRGPDEPPPRVKRWRAREPPGPAQQLASLALDRAGHAVRLASGGLSRVLAGARDPRAAFDELALTLRGVRDMTRDALAPSASDPLLHSGGGLSRRFDVLDLPIERLRKLQAPLGATLNDVVLAALAGTLADYYGEQGIALDRLKCLVPMNLRGSDEARAMGNRVGMFNVQLPLGALEPRERLRRIRAATSAAKRDQRGAAAPALFELAAALPAGVFRFAARRALGRVDVVCTNVPGTRDPRFLGGAAVEAIYPFVSVVEGTPLVMAVLSNCGTLHVGIDTDPEVVRDPARIVTLFEAQLAALESPG